MFLLLIPFTGRDNVVQLDENQFSWVTCCIQTEEMIRCLFLKSQNLDLFVRYSVSIFLFQGIMILSKISNNF